MNKFKGVRKKQLYKELSFMYGIRVEVIGSHRKGLALDQERSHKTYRTPGQITEYIFCSILHTKMAVDSNNVLHH